MTYERPELLERLAAEYVLGTLRGGARRRFERLCGVSAAARVRVHRWEDDLGILSAGLAPVQPRGAWSGRASAGGCSGRSRRRGAAPRDSRSRQPWWDVALLVGLFVREQQRARLETLAVLGAERCARAVAHRAAA